MKKKLSMIGMLLISGISFAQTDRLWSESSRQASSEIFENKTMISNPKVYNLNINGLKNTLTKAPKRLSAGENQNSSSLLPLYGENPSKPTKKKC